VSFIEPVNSFGLKPFTCVNSFSPVVNSVNSFLILLREAYIQEKLTRKPFTPFTTPVKTLHKTLHNCSQPFTHGKNQQIKNTENDFRCLKSTLSGNKKVYNITIMRHSFQLIDFKEVTKGIFYMFSTGRIFKILSHLASIYRPFCTLSSHFGSYMRLFSHFHFNGA